MAIIETRNLSKRFKDLLAVDDVNLRVEEGECFGLLGPNGAGKTSLIRMITAVSPPLAGEITVDGLDVAARPRDVKAILGVVPQIDNLDEDLTVIQNLSWIAPLTPVVMLMRALFLGEFGLVHVGAVAYIVAVSAVFFALALVMMRRRLTV